MLPWVYLDRTTIFIGHNSASYVFDFSNGDVSECAGLGKNRSGMGMVLYDDKIYGFGGGVAMGTNESTWYNFEYDIWTPIAELTNKSDNTQVSV